MEKYILVRKIYSIRHTKLTNFMTPKQFTITIISFWITAVFLVVVAEATAVDMSATVPENEINKCVRTLQEAGYLK